MTTVTLAPTTPPALLALKEYPALWQQAETGLSRQAERIAERQARFVLRHSTLRALDAAIESLDGGLVSLEGESGSGVTSILCHLAASRPYVFWLQEDDGGQGVEALCAQLIALEKLSVPLVPPAARSDPRILEQLIEEAAQQHSSDAPLIIIIDALSKTDQPIYPTSPLLPNRLPPNVVLIYGCMPGARPPLTPAARVIIDQQAADTDELCAMIGATSPATLRETLVARSQGNGLFLRLASGLLASDIFTLDDLPTGLDKLHAAWWERLNVRERRLALLLTAAGEPLPDLLCCELLGADPQPIFARWTPLLEQISSSDAEENEITSVSAFYHHATPAFIARHARQELAQVHAEIVAFAGNIMGLNDGGTGTPSVPPERYLLRQFIRHAALSSRSNRTRVLPIAASRMWVRFQQRRETSLGAARDAAWELRTAVTDGPLLRMIRSTFLTSSLATLARYLPPDAPAEALIQALPTPERDVALKRILDLCDQLPDGRAKAQVLRRLGEVCYTERRMRTTAMRLLSQALDMEAQEPPRSWRDEREHLLAAFTRAALDKGTWNEALTISTHINHPERRGVVETEITRRLLADGDLDHAEVVAHGITHESMRAWALAEVAVARARSGDLRSAEELLASLTLETANAWAQIELACDLARINDQAARERIERLPTEGQRDRGRASLAHALAEADKDGDALAVAEQIHDVAIRVTALLDLRLTLEGLVAMLAVEQATSAISALEGDDRVPLIAALAAAHAALGRRERAVSIAMQLTEDEERSRALARVAVALVGSGEIVQAQEVIALLTDDDDRDWPLDELARTLSLSGKWEEARAAGQRISDPDQRVRTLAELAIEQARSGDPFQAHTAALKIELASERTRALTAIVPLLVAAGGGAQALATQDLFESLDARSRYQTALVTALAAKASMDTKGKAQAAAWLHARKLSLTIVHPLDRVRALLALAQSALAHNPVLAQSSLALAMQAGAASRSDGVRCLELAAPLLAHLGGAKLLVEASAAVEEVDEWLQG